MKSFHGTQYLKFKYGTSKALEVPVLKYITGLPLRKGRIWTLLYSNVADPNPVAFAIILMDHVLGS